MLADEDLTQVRENIDLGSAADHAVERPRSEVADMNPRVAVIVLNWNGQDVLGHCLRSLMASDYLNLQILVVDNGSSDGSIEYVQNVFPTVQILSSQTNLGFAAGNNLGIRQMLQQGVDYILLLNNDTVVDEQCVSYLVRTAEGDPSYGALNPKIYYFDPPDRLWYAGGAFSLWKGVTEHWGRKKSDTGRYDRTRAVTFLTGCALFLRSSVLRQVGLLDEQLVSYAEDADLCFRVRRAGHQLGYVPTARVWHKEGFSALKHQGQAFRYHLYVRNSLWVLTRYAHPIQLFVAYPYCAFNLVMRLIALGLIRGDLKAAAAPLKAVADFIKMAASARRRKQAFCIPAAEM